MSRGPGRIEQAIERLFVEQASKTFSTNELARVAYPPLDQVEKRHRVAVLRAADKVALRLHWEKWQCERFGWGNRYPLSEQKSLEGRGAVYVNPQDLWSYAQGRLRTDNYDGRLSEAKWDDMLGQGGSFHKYVQPGGAWWIHVERRKHEIAGSEPPPELQALIEKEERGFKALMNAAPFGKVTDNVAARRKHRRIANMDASVCGCCGRSLVPDEPVARVPLYDGRSPFGGGPRSIIELQCLDCCGDEREVYYASHCLSCRRVVYQRPRLGRFRTFCCILHRRRYYRPSGAFRKPQDAASLPLIMRAAAAAE
jgi:hypothetical protein